MHDTTKQHSLLQCRRNLGELAKNNSYTLTEDISFKVFDKMDFIKVQWDGLMPDEWFYKSAYLKSLEDSNPDHIANLYVLVSKAGILSGALLLQRTILEVKESFNYEQYSTNRSTMSIWWQRFRQWFLSMFSIRILTIGNLFLTGNYGIMLSSFGSKEEQFLLAQAIVNKLKIVLKKSPYRFKAQLYKDFFVPHVPDKKVIEMVKFRIDPNMILDMNKSWNHFDDYLLDMKSKYRVRMKSALKRASSLTRRTMSLEEIVRHEATLYKLYSDLLDGAGFVLAKGKQNYFTELKRAFGESFMVVGYWSGDELVAFYTWVQEGDKMDTHFIGFRQDLNNQFQLYLNILLDLVRDAISIQATKVYFFRTALEIKSSIGASPHEMVCYFRLNNTLLNRFVVLKLFPAFVPKQTWEQRHPFKGSTEEGE